MKNISESKINKKILKSIAKIGLVAFMFIFVSSIDKIQGTNAFFTDEAHIEGIEFRAGKWIPTLTVDISPSEPADDGWYPEKPCLKFSSDIEDVMIHYFFKGKTSVMGMVRPGLCVFPPEGESEFWAYAVNNENKNWVSETIRQDFKVSLGIKAGEMIINEVMWMGSKDRDGLRYDGEDDQWVELKNVSGRDLHLKGLYLTYKKNSGSEVKLARITNNRVVKDGEYFLIAKYNEKNSAIENIQRDNNETGSDDDMANFEYEKFQIKLYRDDSKKVLIDTAGDGTQEPKEGNKDHFYSMAREKNFSDGSDYDNWYTCLDASSTSLYWDFGRTERGTPGHKNLSQNDPISPADNSEQQNTATESRRGIIDEIIRVVPLGEVEQIETNDLLDEQRNPEIIPEENFDSEVAIEEVKEKDLLIDAKKETVSEVEELIEEKAEN